MIEIVDSEKLLEKLNEAAKEQRNDLKKKVIEFGVEEKDSERVVDIIYEYLEKNPDFNPIEAAIHIFKGLSEAKNKFNL